MADKVEPAGRPGFQPVHPGQVLARQIAALGLPKSAIAAHLGITRTSLYDLLAGEKAVTADMAARLGRAFGNSARFWLNLQVNHDAWEAEKRPEIKKIGRLTAA